MGGSFERGSSSGSMHKVKRRSFVLFCKQRQKLPMVVVGMKDVLPVIVARDYVIKSALDLDSPLSRHTREILSDA